ncbi:MAG: efflux RND transporter periplasmic adaptor subunit [Gammaproteobacteria bacterium]|nr:efflux RND transporter periplasmic adaptor subunit [Gammaproteobacteria bacterium]
MGRAGRRIAAIAVILIAGGAGIWYSLQGGTENATATTTRTLRFAEATVTDLEQTETVSGTLGYTSTDTILNRLNGTLVSSVDDDSTLEQGDTLFVINDQPVTLLYGDSPAWRPMRKGSEGADVTQLEDALVALGYDPDGNVTIDEEFTSYTRTMVKDWQEDIGAPVDGIVDLGEVVFLPGPVRVAGTLVQLGSGVHDGTPMLSTSSSDPVVTVTLDPSDEGLFEVDDRVTVTLPDGSDMGGIVTSLDTSIGQGGATSTSVTISLDDPKATASFGNSVVDVSIVTDAAYDVLAVPVTALLALSEGGYAVEIDDGGSTHLVAVEPGMYADGLVEITSGELTAGDRVVVP